MHASEYFHSLLINYLFLWFPVECKLLENVVVVVVQLLNHVQLLVTPWTAAWQASLSFTISQSLLNSCPLSQWCYLTISRLPPPFSFLPSIFPSIKVFSNELALRIWWPKYCSFSFGISPSEEYSGLISFRIDWFDLLAVQGTFKSLLHHHSSKTSTLWHAAFFMVQLSHSYMTTEKTIALIIWTFVSKMISLLFNTLCLS